MWKVRLDLISITWR